MSTTTRPPTAPAGSPLIEEVAGETLALLLQMHSAGTPLICQLEVTMAQVKTMLTVATNGHATIGEIARNMGIGLPAASATVDRLVNIGWIERTDDPADRRRAIVKLTPAGQQQVETIWRVRRDLLLSWISRMEDADLQMLAHGIRALRRSANQDTELAAPKSALTAANA